MVDPQFEFMFRDPSSAFGEWGGGRRFRGSEF
jgi:hypothetical protein